jgi:hypothetical protein
MAIAVGTMECASREWRMNGKTSYGVPPILARVWRSLSPARSLPAAAIVMRPVV